ncbi:MAG TPA: preprotein translocase subunit YajC [Bacteroidia bacterium]|nr:preprotein translocase subunit YajC [Bacteroidia bacterium]HOZ91159.1 preprotein translocase subunit YajC [Bacteroidia bacterium]HQW17447.1 preprotein translocase subunit YajC [Bacteroidia bacterium]HQW48521.1 preprotein translocase subunit YajC [Bacteroidia bacterium]HQX70708.1 preprotein translocase subunit YajC [Bacteroidia bacterium]
MMYLTILLQSQGNMAMQQFLMLGLIIVIMYFFMLRPQMKKMKVEKQFKESINKGDKVVTIGGVHGKITEVGETFFMIEIDNNVKIKIDKTAVSAEASKQYRKTDDKK